MIDLDVDLFGRNKSIAWREACHFVGSLRWMNLSGETVMDVGCGNAQNSTTILIDGYREVAKIIAIDNCELRIRVAEEINTNPKISYVVADVQDAQVTSQWANSMSRIISIHCFHWLQDPIQALKNIHGMLIPGGRVGICSIINAHNFDVHTQLKEGKWKEYLQNATIVPPVNQFEESDYKNLLESIGFDVDMCELKDMCFTFDEEHLFRDFLMQICPLVPHIPMDKRVEFSHDLYNGMIERCGRVRGSDSRRDFTYMSMRLAMRKRV